MSTTDERVLRTLRAQAWERAKGELRAVLQTYWAGTGDPQTAERMQEVTEQFIKQVEEEGLT